MRIRIEIKAYYYLLRVDIIFSSRSLLRLHCLCFCRPRLLMFVRVLTNNVVGCGWIIVAAFMYAHEKTRVRTTTEREKGRVKYITLSCCRSVIVKRQSVITFSSFPRYFENSLYLFICRLQRGRAIAHYL